MKLKGAIKKSALALAITAGMSSGAYAQVTSSGMSGSIKDESGNPVADTTITIKHIPTGTTRVVEANENGAFNISGLRVGGPYTVEFDSDTLQDSTLTGVFIQLGEITPLTVTLNAASEVERIAVVGAEIASSAFGKVGPSVSFGLEDLQQAPAINRDINDVIRVDPRIYVDEAGAGGIQCAGKSPRFNSLTVDGVRQNDQFGLNSNGYPTERMPFPYDAIDQVAVELAPFDVIYGGFTACNINAVTKSGTNEVSGSVFYDFTNQSMRGDSLEGDSVEIGDFEQKRFGFSIGAPLIEDTLFLFANYEKQEGVNLLDRGAIGTGAVQEVSVTQAEISEISEIANSLYQFDPGPIPSGLDNEDEKLLVKLDWNINESHRLALTYLHNDGNNFQGADRDNNEIEFLKHHYERGAELNAWVGSLYSDWNDHFSTEIRLISQKLDNRQISLEGDGTVGGNDFGEIRVALEDREGLEDVDVFLGSDDSRQANDLDWDQFGFILRGTYYFDNGHTLIGGYEQDDFDVFNVFIQHTDSEIRFSGIDAFRNGLASAIYYNNAPSLDPLDAAAEWGYKTHALYLQDEFYLTDDLLITAGFRYDWYTTSDAPVENAEFTADYGFSNSTNLDGAALFQPRLGFNYTLGDFTELRGGIGLYSGGNPNVWLSNNFSNNNVLQFGARGRAFCYTPDFERRATIPCPNGQRSLFDSDVVYAEVEDGAPNGPGYGIPSELVESVQSGSGDNFELNYLDPDFEIPSEWKIAAGITHETESEYVIEADFIYSITNDAAIVLRGDIEEVGITDDGYVDYDSNRLSSFVLTNTSETPKSISISTSVSKSWDNGIELTTGYAYNDAEDVQPMGGAVAFSNYQERAFTNPNEQVVSTSDWNIEHRFTVDFRYSREFFGNGLKTTFSAFGVAQSGRPYSLTLSARDGNGVFGFTPFIDTNNVLPQGGVRNSEESPWWTKVDIAVRQDLPAFHKDHSANLYFVMNNFTNFLNDDWGILEQAASNRVLVGTENPVGREGDVSLWEMVVGVNYRF